MKMERSRDGRIGRAGCPHSEPDVPAANGAIPQRI
jgi:hypothetical protein